MIFIIRNHFSFCMQILLFIQINMLFTNVQAEMISFQADNFEHIEFRRIKSNYHTYQNQQLQIYVDDSASFLMKPFENIKKVSQVKFKWRSKGAPKIKNAQHEEQRVGDDAVFKLGLLLEGKDSFPNPLLPSWMKRVEKLLKYPSENMIYLVVGAKHATGEQWANPYNKRVTMIAIDSVKDNQGWQQSSYHFEMPVNVVALWLMSDGDNTDSKFTVFIKDINIK